MKILKNVLCVILSFILVLFLIIYLCLGILRNNILNKEYLLLKMEETEFYLQVSREVQNGFENYIYQSGLPEDTIKNLFTEEMIKQDVNSIIDCLYEGTEINLSDDLLRENLNTRIQEYISSQEKLINNEGKKSIEKFEDLFVEEYKNNVSVSDSLFKEGHIILEKINFINEKIYNIPLIAIIIIIIIIILLNIKNLLLAINFIAISFLSLGVLIKIAVNLVFSSINIDNLLLLSSSLSNLIINISKEILYKLDDNATLFIVCSCIAIITVAILNNINTDEKKMPKRRKIKK